MASPLKTVPYQAITQPISEYVVIAPANNKYLFIDSGTSKDTLVKRQKGADVS
jgi:hypothetical protein